jgi:HSP20 family protein
MSTTRTWDPFGEMLSLRDAMQQLLEGSVIRPGTWLGGTAASQSFPLNVSGTAEELHVEALLPGVSPEDVDVNLDRGVLTITARRHGPETPAGQQWYLQEFQPGQCSRSFALPFPVEHEQITAHYTNGVLTLTLPKAEAAKPKRIAIGTGHTQAHLDRAAQ